VPFNEELEDWCRQRCGVFSEESEHKLEYTDLHEEFCQLFEKRITSILEDGGHSVDEFWEKVCCHTCCRFELSGFCFSPNNI
jgi:hypothetical protein